MATPPETKYAHSGGVSIAYQVVGSGPFDLLMVPGFVSHLEQAGEYPAYARFLNRLASFSRLILLDKRGTGMSDRSGELATLEQRMDDVRVVMEAVGSTRVVLFGVSEGGPMSILFAATYPERASSLILYGSFARRQRAPDWPWGTSPEAFEASVDALRKGWGGPYSVEVRAPTVANDTQFCLWWAKYLRLSASPGAAINILRMNMSIDVRDILPSIHIPTLILHRSGDRSIPVLSGRHLGEHIPGAKYVELPGDDHLFWVGDSDAIADQMAEFLTGKRQTQEQDRILATVMFTDIVASTQRAAQLGDRRWMDLLNAHHALMEQLINRFRGTAIKNTGDGFLATFDGPARAIRCACALRDEVHKLGIEIRAGLHTGEIELTGKDVGGIAVHMAARVLGKAADGEVWVSRTVRDLVAGSGIEFSERGVYELNGIPGEWPLLAVK